MVRPTALNYVTTPFGVPGEWMAGAHTGVDYRAPVGTKIFATRKGKVVHAGYGGSYGPAYGMYVVLQSRERGRKIQHLYAHLSATRVRVGQRVKAGDVIGLAGETGNAFGPHLHYEERYAPFNYWSYRRPAFLSWQPRSKKRLRKILKKMGVEK